MTTATEGFGAQPSLPGVTTIGHVPAEAAALPTVAGYDILGVLGRGGMGVVYRARQTSVNRLVALKMIRAGRHASPQELSRFLVEAETVAHLHHPHIVQLYEAGHDGGLPYFSLEYIAGGSLSAKLNGAPLGPREAAALVERLARAVQHAHERGVVHRDLKPANVLLDTDGTPKVSDFGLSKRLDGDDGVTVSGAILGTPSYMAPEQATGKSKNAGPLVDVYALGAILYECLTGRPPFRGPTHHDTIALVVGQEPLSVRQLQPATPRDLVTICMKCLRKEPGQRYVSAAALAEDLRSFQAGEPIQARPVGRTERFVKLLRRRPLVAALATAVILVAAAGVGAFAWAFGETLVAYDEARDAEKKKGEALTQAIADRAKAVKAADDMAVELARSERLRYLMNISNAHRLLRSNDLVECQRTLATCPSDLRRAEYGFLSGLLQKKLVTLQDNPQRHELSFAADADGKRLAWANRSDGGTTPITVWDVATAQRLRTLQPTAGGVQQLELSSDGKRLAAATALDGFMGGAFTVWDVETGQELFKLRLDGKVSPYNGIALSARGQYFAGVSYPNVALEGVVKVWDLDRGQEIRAVPTGVVSRPLLSADGKRLIDVRIHLQKRRFHQSAAVWEVASGQQTATLDGVDLAIGARTPFAALARKDTRVFFGFSEVVTIWDLEPLNKLRSIQPKAPRTKVGGREGRTVTGDGQRLFIATEERIAVWDVEVGSELATLHGDTRAVSTLAATKDGRRLFSAGADGIKAWQLDMDEARLVTEVTRFHRLLCVHGTRFLWNEQDVICLWDASTGKATRFRPVERGAIDAVAVSADGARLFVNTSEGDTRGIVMWDLARVEKERFVVRFAGITSASNLVLSGDDKRLCWTEEDFRTKSFATKVANCSTGDVFLHLDGRSVAAAFSADGKRLFRVVEAARAVEVWDLGARKQLATWPADSAISRLLPTADGTRLLLGCGGAKDHGGQILIWDAHTGTELLRLRGHDDGLSSIAVSARQVFSAGAHDNAIKIWNLETGEETMNLRRDSSSEDDRIVLSADGSRLYAGSQDGIFVWELGPEKR